MNSSGVFAVASARCSHLHSVKEDVGSCCCAAETSLMLQELIAALHEASADDLPDMSLLDASAADYGLTDEDGPQEAALLYLACGSAMAHGR